jgi:hypothetical protein
MTWKAFECSRCHEAFPYEPSAKVEPRIEEIELKAGRTCLILANCPHCAAEIALDRETGLETALEKDPTYEMARASLRRLDALERSDP